MDKTEAINLKSTNGSGILRFFRLLGSAFRILKKNDPLRMAGATAFFTCFALPPILIIIFQTLSIFFGNQQIGAEMREVLNATFGADGTNQIRRTIRGMRTVAGSGYIAIGGFVFLLFVASTLFGVIKNSLNDIWKIKIEEKPGFLFNLLTRARAITAIFVTGILFIASILIDGVGVIAGEQIEQTWPGKGKFFTGIWSEIAGLIVVITWFIVLFRFLADGKPSWRACIAGGVLTGLLYSAGKLVLSAILSNSNMASIYGASASIVLILLFVFYSAFIIYYGASFIMALSDSSHHPVQPGKKAFRFELQEIS